MAIPSWLDEVRVRLLNAGVSAVYRERLLEELRDHMEDIRCEERNHAMSAEALNDQQLTARLGKPETIVTAVQREAPRDLFARRHPIITYVLFPIPLLVVSWIAYTFGLAGILSGFSAYKDAVWAPGVVGLLVGGIAYVPAMLLTLAIAWVAVRSETGLTWWLTGAMLVALVSGMLAVTFRMPTVPGSGLLQVGLGFPPALERWPQSMIPLAVTLAFVVPVAFKRKGARPATSPETGE